MLNIKKPATVISGRLFYVFVFHSLGRMAKGRELVRFFSSYSHSKSYALNKLTQLSIFVYRFVCLVVLKINLLKHLQKTNV